MDIPQKEPEMSRNVPARDVGSTNRFYLESGKIIIEEHLLSQMQ